MEKRNKYLIIIIIILVITIGITGFFAYQSYRMSQMDKFMLQSNTITDTQFQDKYVELNNSFKNKQNQITDKEISEMDDLIQIGNQSLSLHEQAYQYADGPYKDLIAIAIKKDRLELTWVELWKQEAQLVKNGDPNIADIEKSMGNTLNEINNAQNDYVTFKSTHLDVKEHTIKYWNSTNV